MLAAFLKLNGKYSHQHANMLTKSTLYANTQMFCQVFIVQTEISDLVMPHEM